MESFISYKKKETHTWRFTNQYKKKEKKKKGLKMLCRVINCNNILNKVIYWEKNLPSVWIIYADMNWTQSSGYSDSSLRFCKPQIRQRLTSVASAAYRVVTAPSPLRRWRAAVLVVSGVRPGDISICFCGNQSQIIPHCWKLDHLFSSP